MKKLHFIFIATILLFSTLAKAQKEPFDDAVRYGKGKNPWDSTFYILINYDSLTMKKNYNSGYLTQVSLQDNENKANPYELQLLNIGIDGKILLKKINSQDIRTGVAWGDRFYAYITVIGDTAQHSIVWTEIPANDTKIKQAYNTEDLLFFAETLLFRPDCGREGKEGVALNSGKVKPILLKNGKYYTTYNKTNLSYYNVYGAADPYPFSRHKREGYNIYGKIVTMKELKKEQKYVAEGHYSAYNSSLRDCCVPRGSFISKVDKKNDIISFFADKIYANPKSGLYNDFLHNKLDIQPAIGFLNIDYAYMHNNLHLKQPFIVKTVNDLPLADFLKSIDYKSKSK